MKLALIFITCAYEMALEVFWVRFQTEKVNTWPTKIGEGERLYTLKP